VSAEVSWSYGDRPMTSRATAFCRPMRWSAAMVDRIRQSVSAKLHYTDTGYGHVVQHHQRTGLQQFYNLLYNKFATSQCQSPTSPHVRMLGCGKFLSVGGEFVVQRVVELLWARPLVAFYNMSVAGVRIVEFGTKPIQQRAAIIQPIKYEG